MLPNSTNSAILLDQAESLIKTNKYFEAETICRLVLQTDSDNLEAHFLLANSAYQQKNWADAAKHYQRAIATAPNIGFLYSNLALALLETECYQEALVALDNSIRLDGITAVNHFHRGLIFQRTERWQNAVEEYEHSLLLNPKHILSRINLSAVLIDMGDAGRAITQCLLGLEFEPDNIMLTGNLAIAYGKEYRYDESLLQYQRLINLVSANEQAEMLGRMANILLGAGRADESISGFDKAVSKSTDLFQKRALHSSKLFVLHYSQLWSPESISQEHRAWGTTYFQPAQQGMFNNTPDPKRRLRIAYISPDFRIHAVVFFLQPVLAAHNREQVQIYCYSDVKRPDAITCQLKENHGVLWRDIAGLNDDTVQQTLFNDEIDILVDLAGHTGGNRLPLFARRVAPVQVSWIGYPNTTGLTAMDYRLTDSKADPPGMTEKLHTEELVRLPDSFLCYRPGADFPPENPLPMLLNRFITFGSLSNFSKVTTNILALWARILVAVPDSRLVFRARGMTDVRLRQEILPIFEQYGVQAERINILGHARSVVDNLRDYHRMDIALDTFPYHGTTTTCEALYMGVPVVTLAGSSHLSRVGASLLQNIGIGDLIAETAEEYVATTVALAGNLRRLLYLRKSLRSTVSASPLTDNTSFTHHLEAAYRMMWQRWCENQRRTNTA